MEYRYGLGYSRKVKRAVYVARNLMGRRISALHRAYKALLRQHGERDMAIEAIKTDREQFPEHARFVEFIEQSECGVDR